MVLGVCYFVGVACSAYFSGDGSDRRLEELLGSKNKRDSNNCRTNRWAPRNEKRSVIRNDENEITGLPTTPRIRRAAVCGPVIDKMDVMSYRGPLGVRTAAGGIHLAVDPVDPVVPDWCWLETYYCRAAAIVLVSHPGSSSCLTLCDTRVPMVF